MIEIGQIKLWISTISFAKSESELIEKRIYKLIIPNFQYNLDSLNINIWK